MVITNSHKYDLQNKVIGQNISTAHLKDCIAISDSDSVFGGVGWGGLWHDNHTTPWPILQAEFCKNSVGLNFKKGRVWQYIS